jgi:hypothetical protein
MFKSAADRNVSPASTPKPPEYVGMAGLMAISIEKYATRPEEGKVSYAKGLDVGCIYT